MGCTGSKDTSNDHDADIDTPTRSRGKAAKTKSRLTHRNPPHSGKDYWSSVRDDVVRTAQDIDTESDSHVMSQGEKEYRALLQRWLKQHGETDPEEEGQPPPRGKDPNSLPFPLPPGVNPAEDLRPWLSTLEAMDTALGEEQVAAWSVLPEDVIKNGLTTPQQQSLLASRDQRKLLHDPQRMRKRREELLTYFAKTYRYKKAKVARFVHWADIMARNQAELQQLVSRRRSSRKQI